ncbi:MAG: DUF4132 domain-containing protein [Clostridia bacterium]|nr:DUF4132 domain-containing protein [Clostridia bacterium]
MVKITNKEILKAINGIDDKEVKAVLLSGGQTCLCSLKFLRKHEEAFRSLIPNYFDEYMILYYGDNSDYSYADRDSYMIYLCIEMGVVKSDDFTSVVNYATAGIDLDFLRYNSPSVVDLFKDSLLKTKDGDKKLLDFVEKNPRYLTYFLPLICSIDSEVFFGALTDYVKSAKLEDTLRLHVLEAMMQSSDKNMLLRCLDEIDNNNYYRFKALNEAGIMMGDSTVTLAPKELVAVLRDAANGNYEKYLNADYRHSYHFVRAYKRVRQEEFSSFVIDALNRSGDRMRLALLGFLSVNEINSKYVQEIFSRKFTLEDLSVFIYKLRCEIMDISVVPMVFESLFELLMSMSKVNYHFKTDEDISFARDVYKSTVVSRLGKLALRRDDGEYIKRLDNIYDTFKEEAQASYLSEVGEKTSLDVRQCTIKFLKTDNYEAINYFDNSNIKLTYNEAVFVSDYLKSKKGSVKSKIVKAFLTSKDSEKIAEYLLSCKEDYKKSAGEEMQKSQGKIDDKKLAKKTERFSWWSESVFKEDKPIDEIEKLAKQETDVKPINPISHKRLKDFFTAIEDFIQANKDYEYAAEYTEGLEQFGSNFKRLKDSDRDYGFEAYPLGREIKALIKDNFTQEEIAGILVVVYCVDKDAEKLYKAVCGKNIFEDAQKNFEYVVASRKKGRWYYDTNEFNIIQQLDYSIAKELLGEEEKLAIVAAFAQENVLDKYKKGRSPYMFCNMLAKSNDIRTLKALTHFECAFINADVEDCISYNLVEKAFENNLISERLARYFILKQGFADRFLPTSSAYIMRSDYKNKKYKSLLLDFVEKALDVEFNRGSLQTPYSELFRRSSVRVFGAEKFFKAIVALRGLTWVRSSYGMEKNEILSNILKNTVKSENDDYSKFVELIKQYNITDDELMKATLFNPEFVDYTAQYFGVENLKIAIFWYIAHLNETLDTEKQERRIEQIKEFSDISYQDFKDGAFDCNWYAEMVEKVPADILKRIYDNAKYVTVGGLHKRAQRFFDAMNGRIEKAECTEKIKSTRNKDYCLIYSLIPIENREDLLERYTTLAEFARGSKQFGAQRQLSERRTVDIAMENLARVAGYASADIFIFEMEAENPSDIYKTYTVDNVEITPYIDGSKFKIAYNVQRDGKVLSAIPSKYGKDSTVVEIKNQIKKLNQKFRRIISSMENAMNTRVPFTAEQLLSMSRERIISTVLEKLILVADGKACIFDGGLKSIDGKPVESREVYIAHPVELKKLGLLSLAIEYVVKGNIRQPFKQVMREIYTKTDIELTQDEVLRFKGFEVDLKKCVAALKGKGWGVSEDIGLRKVYYRTDTVAAIFRECDYLFTVDYDNVNRELHGIYFLKRKTGEIIPLKDVDDITFSETLRDVDLMISISSKVIYDFAMAMSTVEMRQEVLKSIVEILGLSNVSFLKDNIKVDGKRGTYVVNIRTGLVFKEGRGNLAIDTVYSVDKPILLDFVDEDPMTADIISKAVVLAADDKIKDPALLREIED